MKPKFPPENVQNDIKQKNICEPCKKPRCGTCKIIQNSKSFKSNVTNKTFLINDHINCNSKNVIYQLNCNHCEKQYIGQTSNHLRIRMTGHRYNIFHNDLDKPIPLHAKEHNQNSIENCYNLIGINKIKPTENEKINRYNLKKCELAHQLVLKSKTPTGLNLR